MKQYASIIFLKFKNKLAFTLVELIVVILIISILAVISFLTLGKWINKSQDVNRLVTINNIENSLNLYYAKKNIFPTPDDSVAIYYSGLNIGLQGYIGTGVFQALDVLNKLPIDTSTNSFFEYSLLSGGKYYQIATNVNEISYLNGFGNNTYAKELQDYYIKIIGNFKNTLVLYTGGNYIFSYFPSLFFDKTLVVGNKIIINPQNSISYKNGFKRNNKFITKFQKINALKSSISSENDKKTERDNLVQIFSGLSLGLTNTGLVDNLISNSPGVMGDSTIVTPTHRCYYKYNALANADSSWSSSDLYYNTGSNSCYVFGDENADTKNACNKWVTDNVTTGGTFVWVPARRYVSDGTGTNLKDSFYQRSVTYSGNNYVCRGFAVMKYEAKILGVSNDGNIAYVSTYAPESRASGNPWAKLTQNNALNECLSLGTNYHLITNNEWMGMARNVEKQSSNWSGGVVNIGHIEATTNPLAATGDDLQARYGEQSYDKNIWQNKRTHDLSNGQKLRDVSANLREHTNRSNLPTTSNTDKLLGNGNLCGLALNSSLEGTGSWETIGSPHTTCGNMYGPIQSPNGTTKNMGVVFTYGDVWSAMLRGGQRSDGELAGIFAISFRWNNNVKGGTTGFRCTR